MSVKWINIKEQMPPLNERVIGRIEDINYPDRYRIIDFMTYLNNINKEEVFGGWKVTHWMLIPKFE